MLSFAAARAVAPPAPAVSLHRRASAARARDRRQMRVGHVIRLAPTVSSVATRAKRSDDEDKADVSEASDATEGSDGKSSDKSEAASADASADDASATAPETKNSDASDEKKDPPKTEASGLEEASESSGENSLLSSAEDDVAPALEGDWRDFRARLVSLESGPGSSTDEAAAAERLPGRTSSCSVNRTRRSPRRSLGRTSSARPSAGACWSPEGTTSRKGSSTSTKP